VCLERVIPIIYSQMSSSGYSVYSFHFFDGVVPCLLVDGSQYIRCDVGLEEREY